MTRDELIAKQQLQIERLKKRLEWARQDKADIKRILICIGGPLNDNVLKYSAEQRKLLHRILDLAEMGDHEELSPDA